MRDFQSDIHLFAGEKIIEFHKARLTCLQGMDLRKVLRKKNPYLFRAKNLLTSSALMESLLEAYISSSEEEMFGTFLEELAIFIAHETSGGWKSAASGIDIELEKNGFRYVIAVKSGPSWGNSSQYRALEKNFRDAISVLRQSTSTNHVQPVLGICYGKTKTVDRGLYQKITGQNFWFFLSDIESLYTDIIEPIGHEASRHFDMYVEERDKLVNRFTKEFLDQFCSADGSINWKGLVEFNSGNTKNHSWG